MKLFTRPPQKPRRLSLQLGFIGARRALLGRGQFNIKRDLFGRGEQGVWYDPQDLSTMFQDSAGTTPVTVPGGGSVDPPVGLIYDKRLGLVRGPNIILNGDFSNGTTNWTGSSATLSVVSGKLQVQNTGAATGFGYQVLTTVIGTTYTCSVDYNIISGTGKVAVGIGGGGSGNYLSATLTGSGTLPFVFTATATSTTISVFEFTATVALQAQYDNITVSSLPGNHAIQATAAARPTLSGRYNILTGTATMGTQSVTTIAASYTLSIYGTGSVTLTGTSVAGPLNGTGAGNRVTLVFTPTAGTLTLTVAGSVTTADLRLTSDAALNIPAYQAVTDASNYSTAGFFDYGIGDGIDNSWSSTSGGGASTAALIVLGFTTNAIGAAQTLWSDRTGNTGLKLEITAAGNIAFSGGNGASINTATGAAVSAGTGYVVTAQYDGTNLSVQLNNGTVTTQACALSAGTAAITLLQDNGAASGRLNGRIYQAISRNNAPTSAAQVAQVKRYVGNKMGVPL